MLRHAFHLVQLTPGPLKGVVRCEYSESPFEELLEHGAFDSAAVALIGSPICFELNTRLDAGKRVVDAKVWLPNQAGLPKTASAESVASALLGAWSICLVALRQRSLGDGDQDPRQYPHIVPPAQRPKLTEH
jgi:hypothetical protein